MALSKVFFLFYLFKKDKKQMSCTKQQLSAPVSFSFSI